MVAVTEYIVTAEHTGKWWVLQAVDVPGAISQVARLDHAEQIREAIAFVAGVPEADVEVVVHPVLEVELEAALTKHHASRQHAEDAANDAADSSRRLARELAERGFSLRDIGVMLGVSHQRVHQLINDRKRQSTSAK